MVQLTTPNATYGRAETDWQAIHTRGFHNWLQEVVKPLDDTTCAARIMTCVVTPQEVAVMARGEGDVVVLKGEEETLDTVRASLQPIQWELSHSMRLAWLDHVNRFASWAGLKGATVLMRPDLDADALAKERDGLRDEVVALRKQIEMMTSPAQITPAPMRTPTPVNKTAENGIAAQDSGVLVDPGTDNLGGTSFVTAASLLKDSPSKGQAKTAWRKTTSKADDSPGSWANLRSKKGDKDIKTKKITKMLERKLKRTDNAGQLQDEDEDDVEMCVVEGQPVLSGTQGWVPPDNLSPN